MGTQPLQPYEVHLKEHFMSRMNPELAQMVKRSCVTWKTCPLADILQHAEHAEDGLHRTEEQKKQGRQRKLEDAQLTMFNACANTTPKAARGQPGRSRGCGRGRGRGRSSWTHGNYDPDVCHNCGRQGHWRAECPEPRRERSAFPESD